MMQPDHEELQAPPQLVAALLDSGKEGIFVPAAVDAAVIGRARKHLDAVASSRRRLSVWQWAAVLAILGLIAITLTSLLSNRHSQVVRHDFNGDGNVDVLDALALARKVEAGGQLSVKWDLNSDGTVNGQDADAILTEVVLLARARPL